MRIFLFALSFVSLNALACWKIEGSLSVNGESVVINQKFNHDKTYSFQAKNYLFHVKIPSTFDLPENMNNAKNGHLIEIQVQQKEGTKIREVTQAKILVRPGNEATMTKEDDQTNILSSFTFKITDI